MNYRHIFLVTAVILVFGIVFASKREETRTQYDEHFLSAQMIEDSQLFQESPHSFLVNENISYTELVESGIQPKIQPEFEFPVSFQYKNGCFGFAVNSIYEYKYNEVIDLIQAEKTIEKSRDDLWTYEHILSFLELYNLEIAWHNDAETFFRFLSDGEPVLIQYKLPISESKWIGHFVSAYSFDENGVWVSDSLTGKRTLLPFNKVFQENKTDLQFSFASIVKGDD